MKKFLFCLSSLLICSSAILANKTSVEIRLPSKVQIGSEINLVVIVSHKGNKKLHHTDWVNIKIDGKEVMRWQFTKKDLPTSENFTLEYKLVANEETTIEAEGHCNIHGSGAINKSVIKSH